VPFEEQWGRVKQVAAEVRELAPVLLSVEPTPPFSVGRTPWLHWTVRRVGATVTLIAVNDEGYARRATFDLGKTPKTARLRGSAAPVPLQSAELTAELEPFGVNVYEIEFRG
jgi:hypothetical protein